MKLTTEQIAQAERLQAKGLCQDSENWVHIITDTSIQEFTGIYKTGKKQNYILKRKIIGPLLTFEKVWPYILRWYGPLLDADTVTEAMLLISSIMIEHDLKEKPDQAAIEALLYLSEGE